MRRYIRLSPLLLIFPFFLQNCGGSVVLSHKDKLNWAIEIYSFQYDDYQDLREQPVTAESARILQAKYALLKDAESLILIYLTALAQGDNPTHEDSIALTRVINRLIGRNYLDK
jgi:hypothetical protein